MLESIPLHQGLIPHHLITELTAHRAIEGRRSTCYLDLNVRRWGTPDAVRIEVKNFLAEQRKRIDSGGLPHAVRVALRRDLELVEQCVPETIGERHTRSLACFVAAERGFGQAIPLPWPLRNRAFFEEQFVVWPLHLALEQSDRYGICLTDKDDGRLFHYFMGQIQDVSEIHDDVPGKVRFPDPWGESGYQRKHVVYYRRHLDKVGEAALRLWQREPFERLIIGGLWEIFAEFEGHLHRYLRDRIVARWDIDAQHTPTPTIQERAEQEETHVRQRQAEATWQTIHDHRRQRGMLSPDEVFSRAVPATGADSPRRT
jgi:peptide subunit release factor 1 (eRF1)